MPVIINGNGTVDTGTVLVGNSDITGLAAGALPATVIGAGGVLQVVQATKKDAFATTSGSAVDITGLSVSITPTSASSKILCLVMLSTGHSGNDVGHSYMYLVRNSSNIFVADTAGSRTSATIVGNYLEQVMQHSPIIYLDSPATTSSTTYKMQVLTTAGTFYVNRSGRDGDTAGYDGRGVSSITVMEIAA